MPVFFLNTCILSNKITTTGYVRTCSGASEQGWGAISKIKESCDLNVMIIWYCNNVQWDLSIVDTLGA